MNLDDIVVEVRDRNLVRVGTLRNGFTLEATPLMSKVGAWTLTIPSDHALVDTLLQPGSGIIVTGPDDVIISGPVAQDENSITTSDVGGTITLTGVCDNIWIADRLASPDPTWSGSGAIAADFDERTGAAESLMHAYVNANAGPGATADRRVYRLVMGNNYGRGPSLNKSARWDNLAELVTGIGASAGATAAVAIPWRVVQRGGSLAFETRTALDRSNDVRLDVRNNTLSGYKLAVSAPTATHAIVGAQDVDFDRLFATVTSVDSAAASALWGRRIETFVNQAYVDDVDEWTASAIELLADQGVTATSVQAIPNDDDTLRFGKDYSLGDKIGVVAEGREYSSVVSGVVLKVDDSGVRLGLALGDTSTFNSSLQINNDTKQLNSRLQTLEATQGLTGGTHDSGWITLTPTAGADAGGALRPLGYHRVGDEVEARGRINFSGTLGAGATIFTFPAGYRPTGTLTLILAANTPSSVRADITAAGALIIQDSVSAGGFISLDQLRFRIT